MGLCGCCAPEQHGAFTPAEKRDAVMQLQERKWAAVAAVVGGENQMKARRKEGRKGGFLKGR